MKDDLIDRLEMVTPDTAMQLCDESLVEIQRLTEACEIAEGAWLNTKAELEAALSSVLPEEVEKLIDELNNIRVMRSLAATKCGQAADLIERLARENAALDLCAKDLMSAGKHIEEDTQRLHNVSTKLIDAEQRIEELEEELESERINNEDLANATYYKGNSVSWWHSKAGNYKNALGETWDALRAAGVHCDGKKSTADGVKELQQRIKELEVKHDIAHANDPKQWARLQRLDAALDEALNNSDLTIREIQQKVAKARAGE